MKKNEIKVWDAAIRVFHGLLIPLLCLSFYSGFQDKLFTDFGQMHLISGLVILTLVLSRIIWGFVGSDTAKFSSFLASPKTVLSYLKSREKYQWIGHNPAGGWMVVAMLVLLLSQAIFGLYSSDDMDFYGPLHDSLGSDFSGWAMWAHKQIWILIILIAGVHVVAVVVTQLTKNVSLIKPMITGTKEHGTLKREQGVRFKSFKLFILICLLITAVVWGAIFH